MHLHPSPTAGSSQCACIHAELLLCEGERVSLPRLHAVSGSMAVHSRINDLRALKKLRHTPEILALKPRY